MLQPKPQEAVARELPTQPAATVLFARRRSRKRKPNADTDGSARALAVKTTDNHTLKQLERERDARLAEEEKEEEGRNSCEVLSTDSEQDPGTATRVGDSQTTGGSTSHTGTTGSSN